MRDRKSTCLYLDQEVVETAKKFRLNMSRVSDNALLDAPGRLRKPKQGTSLQTLTDLEGRGGDSDPCARLSEPRRLHRPVGYQATSPRPLFPHSDYFCSMLIYVF